MILFLSICLLAVTAGTIIQTNELHKTRKALEASDSVVLKAEEYLMRERVEHEIDANPVLTGVLNKFYAQTEKGIKKYPNTVNPADYTLVEWVVHYQQEMIDGAVYGEILIGEIAKLVKRVEELEKENAMLRKRSGESHEN